MSKLTDNAYGELVKKASPPTNSLRNIPLAFLFGGAICTLGQGLINLYQYFGAEEKTAYAATTITLVFLSSLLTGLNVYDKIAKYGGAGTLVPVTGFANAVTSPALEFKSEGYVLGLGAKMFSIAGPVIVYSTAAGILYGLIIYLLGLY